MPGTPVHSIHDGQTSRANDVQRRQANGRHPLIRWSTLLPAIGYALALVLAPPLWAQIPLKIYGQHLVDEAVAQNPELLVAMMHVTPPGGSKNIVIASNIGRIGKEGDQDDLRVIRTGIANTEIASNGRRFEVELPLLGVSSNIVGALGLVFPYRAGDDRDRLAKKAQAIRNQLARRILNAGNLLEPYPFDARATTKTHAQKLLDQTLAKHPGLLVMSLHVTPPNGSENITLASNIGRIGKRTGANEMRVIATGKPNVVIGAPIPKTVEVRLRLHDVAGKTIGGLTLVFAGSPDNEARFLSRGERIRDELGHHIESLEKLVALDP